VTPTARARRLGSVLIARALAAGGRADVANVREADRDVAHGAPCVNRNNEAADRKSMETTRRPMKLHYCPETDCLYIELKRQPGTETREVADGLNVDIDAERAVVGFDIDRASRRFDLSTLETVALPLRSTTAA
jgi:uncharacterized protein YuzE